MRPAPDEVDLWWAGPDTEGTGAHPRVPDERVLSPDERLRAERLVAPGARADFVRHRTALRTVLAGYLDAAPGQLRFAYGPFGRPRLDLPGAAPAFSLSHAGRWALIAVGGAQPLGVDLESTGQRVDIAGLARRFLPGLDLEGVAPHERRAAFFAGWTRYEALLKAAGSGLGRPLPPGSHEWAVHPLEAPPGYAATLVTAGQVTTVRCRAPFPTAARPAATDAARRPLRRERA